MPLVVFGLLLLALALAGALAAQSMRVEARRRGAAELESVAALKLEELAQWRRSAMDETAFAASYPFVHTVSLRVVRGGLDAALVEHGREVLAAVADHRGFYTTKAPGQGTGLGLATVYGIVKQSNGYILANSAAGQGTSFEIYLPRTLDAPRATSATAAVVPAGGDETILLVEDDPQVRDITVRALRSGGYRVLVARNEREALAVAGSEARRLDLLVTDVVMPGGYGPAVAESLRRLQPDLRVLYVSGYTQDAIAERGVLADGIELLHKPFTPSALLSRVRTVLDAPGS